MRSMAHWPPVSTSSTKSISTQPSPRWISQTLGRFSKTARRFPISASRSAESPSRWGAPPHRKTRRPPSNGRRLAPGQTCMSLQSLWFPRRFRRRHRLLRPPAPAPPPPPPVSASCADLQSAINAVTGGPINFANDGFSLTPADNQSLPQVADKLKACPNAHATINGYGDTSGTEAINIPLSSQRAQSVADFLVAHGVAASRLVVRGLGSANPIAPNDTAEGRAKNRRVEIVVS